MDSSGSPRTRNRRGLHRRPLHLTPGMTGEWQILESARIPLRDMVKIDYLYVATGRCGAT